MLSAEDRDVLLKAAYILVKEWNISQEFLLAWAKVLEAGEGVDLPNKAAVAGVAIRLSRIAGGGIDA